MERATLHTTGSISHCDCTHLSSNSRFKDEATAATEEVLKREAELEETIQDLEKLVGLQANCAITAAQISNTHAHVHAIRHTDMHDAGMSQEIQLSEKAVTATAAGVLVESELDKLKAEVAVTLAVHITCAQTCVDIVQTGQTVSCMEVFIDMRQGTGNIYISFTVRVETDAWDRRKDMLLTCAYTCIWACIWTYTGAQVCAK